MANKLIKLENAKREVERLNKYIDLVENYKTDTLDRWIIKQYAITNSITKIVDIAGKEGITYNGESLNRDYIIGTINGKAQDDLHRILRSGYRQKIKPNKRTLKAYGKWY